MLAKKIPRHQRPPIQSCLKVGDEILVQVIKEGISDKGPSVTSYLSIPGRFLVWMPFMEELGVTKKVEDPITRKTLRNMLRNLEVPEGFGVIVRTAAMGHSQDDLARDLAYLKNLWRNIDEGMQNKTGRTQELYSESDLVIRTLRDAWSADVKRVVCDDLESARARRRLLEIGIAQQPNRSGLL